MKTHTTKDGTEILLSDMTTSHLRNCIRMIERASKQGILIQHGGGYDSDDLWYDEETLYGKQAQKHLNYKYYVNELNGRNNG